MLKRFFGIHLIAVAVTAAAVACGDTADVVVPTSVAQEIVESALLPTVAAKGVTIGTTPVVIDPTMGISAEAAQATRSAAFETQRAMGWPTPEGLAVTQEPTKAPIDKSDWTTITPPACDSTTNGEVEAHPDAEWDGGNIVPRTAIGWFVDLVHAKNAAALVEKADLVIHGMPIGVIEVEPARNIPGWLRYYQDVRILSVLHGQAPGESVRVIQVGDDFATRRKYLEEYRIGLGLGDYEWPGPLNQCPQILFLNETSVGVFPSVGMIQGRFLLGADGRVSDAPEFDSFLGLDVAQVKQRIAAHSQP
jgi:hypothetical protein